MNLFLTSTAANVMDEIVRRLPKRPQELTVAFVPTAGDPYDETPWIVDDKNKLERLGFKIIELDIKESSKEELAKIIGITDIIFVAGGNTFYLLEKSITSGFDEVVRDEVTRGKIYIGSSAGSVIAGPDIEAVAVFDNPKAGRLENTEAFGLVDFVTLPHFGKEKYGSYHQKVLRKFNSEYKIIPINDEQMIISDGESFQIV